MYLWGSRQMQIEKEHEQRHVDASAKMITGIRVAISFLFFIMQ